MLKVTSTIVLVGLRTFTMGGGMHGPFLVYLQIRSESREDYVFAEEPCKSTNTTSEPCSPVFKEAQPRPSEHSNLEYHINNLNRICTCMYFGLFSIFVIKPIQPDCDKIKGISVLLLETPLSRSKYFSPYTHAQRLTRTPITFCTFAYKQTLHYFQFRCTISVSKHSVIVQTCAHVFIFITCTFVAEGKF